MGGKINTVKTSFNQKKKIIHIQNVRQSNKKQDLMQTSSIMSTLGYTMSLLAKHNQ